MGNKITALTALTAATTDDIVLIVDSPASSAVTKKITIANLKSSLVPTQLAYTQTYSTASKTVPNATASNPPAGGTGATQGAYDTSAHRDAMITSLTNCIADVAALKQVVNALIDDLQALGLVG